MVLNELLMQFQADILGVPVVRPQTIETTALGAAYAAGLAVGVYSGEEEMRANWVEGKRWEPQMSAEDRDWLFNRWRQAVTRTFDWVPVGEKRMG
jgi:glycerol kinase